MDIVVILPVQPRHVARFVRDSAIPPQVALRIFSDSSAALASASKCNKRFDTRSTFTSPHAQTTVLGATLAGLGLGLMTGPQGDPRQQGGAWVLQLSDGGHTWTTLWAHRDRHNADQVPIPVLFAAAGLPPSAYVHPRAIEGMSGVGADAHSSSQSDASAATDGDARVSSSGFTS